MRRDDEPINRDQIVQAALEIVDEGGNGDLSMRAVAKRVDRHVSSLYNHVTNRAELVELLSAHIVKGIDVSGFAALPWPQALAQWSKSYVTEFVAHPNLVQILATSPVRDLPTLIMYETMMTSLSAQGWSVREAVLVIRTVEAHAWGSVFDIVAPQPDIAVYESTPGYDAIQALVTTEPAEYGAWASFEAGLQALIDGLEIRHDALVEQGVVARA